MCGEKIIQPLKDNDDEIVIVFNGEIYNYLSFGNFKSDVECLMYLYKNNENDFVKQLDGDFCFVIFDFKKK